MKRPLAPLAGLALFLGSLAACRLSPPPPEEIGLWRDAADGVSDGTLADLCRDAWEAGLEADPIRATWLGDPRLHGELPDNSLRGREARVRELGELLDRARRLADEALSEADRLTLEILEEELGRERRQLLLKLEEWTVDPLEGPQQAFLTLSLIHI